MLTTTLNLVTIFMFIYIQMRLLPPQSCSQTDNHSERNQIMLMIMYRAGARISLMMKALLSLLRWEALEVRVLLLIPMGIIICMSTEKMKGCLE